MNWLRRVAVWLRCHVLGAHRFVDPQGRAAGDLPVMNHWRCLDCNHETDDWVW